MGSFVKKSKYSVKHGDFTFHYDTAYELGKLVAESGCKMPNPYDPMNTEFDEFSEGYRSFFEGKS